MNKVSFAFFKSIVSNNFFSALTPPIKTNKHSFYVFCAVGIIAALSSSCTPAVDIKILDLDKTGNDFNAAAFYKNKIEKTLKDIATDPSKMDKNELKKKLDENLFIKDTLCFFTSPSFDGQYIDSKSAYLNKNKTHEGIFGLTYKTMSWDQNDSLAVLNGIYFQKLDMLENKDGQLLSLTAMNESKSNASYQKLVDHLKKKYGGATTLLQNKAENLEILEWQSADNKIQLRTKIDSIENILSIENGIKKDFVLETKYTIDYFMVNKKYLKDIQKIKTGEWVLDKDN